MHLDCLGFPLAAVLQVNISQNFSGLRRLLEEGRLPVPPDGTSKEEDGDQDKERCEAEIQETV